LCILAPGEAGTNVGVIVGAVIAVIVVAAAVFALFYWFWWKKKTLQDLISLCRTGEFN